LTPISPSTITKVSPSTMSPISTLNIEKELPKIPMEDNSSSKKSIIKKVKSVPLFRKKTYENISFPFFNKKTYSDSFEKTYSDSLISNLESHFNQFGLILDKNHIIVLPGNVKILNDLSLNLPDENLGNNMNKLFGNKLQLDEKQKGNFWIEYDSNNTKNKGFIFMEMIERDHNFCYEFIGAKNKYELVSYLNQDSHKINDTFKSRNIDMKLTLQKNIKDKELYSFTTWCSILNKDFKI
jgi:hypothetical protein